MRETVAAEESSDGARRGQRRPTTAWHRASRREIGALVLYFAALVAVTDLANVRLGMEIMTVAVMLPAAVTRRLRAFLHDWWYFLLGLVMWNVSGPIAAYSPFPLHLNFMMHVDSTLFVGHQPVQELHRLRESAIAALLSVPAFVTYNLHVPEPYIAGYLLWRVDRVAYVRFAASALILLILGFVAFVLFPAVPPWMAAERFGRVPGVDNGFGVLLRGYRLPFHGTPLFYLFRWRGDAVAAFPSEHAAFPALELFTFASISRRGFLLVAWVAWVAFVVVYLGEHWFTDVLAGWLLAGSAFTMATVAIRPTRRSAGGSDHSGARRISGRRRGDDAALST